MELKPGYKQTDVGVIPEDWAIAAVGSLAAFTSGTGINASALHHQSSDTPIPVYGGNGIAGFTTNSLVSTPVVVVGRVGQKCGEVYLTTGPAWITDNALFPRFIFQPIDLRFFALALKTAGLNSLKNRNDLPLVTQSILHSVLIPLPSSLQEQAAIAEVLIDTDALLKSLEQLIAKKRHLKQGAMQELLTGKRRLPGFSEAWETRRLGDVAPLQRGFDLPNRVLRRGPYPVVYSNGILNHHDVFQVKAPGVVTGRSGTIGNVIYVEQDFWPHNTSLWVTNFKGNDSKFIFYLLRKIGLMRFSTGSGVPTLNRNDVHSFVVSIPASLKEQNAIATILSYMDAEIAEIEAKLAKARHVKQGMMHNLLTGKIRLV